MIADSAVRYLRIDNGLLDEAIAAVDHSSALSLDSYEVEEEEDFGHMDAENLLTLRSSSSGDRCR